MEIQAIIGIQVARHRRRLRLSQEELAARIGLDQAYVSRLESGRLNITVSTLQLLAGALGTEPARLVEDGR